MNLVIQSQLSFTSSIMGNLTIITSEDPELVYRSQDVIWDRFEQAFMAMLGLVTYAPVFREYYYRGLQEFYSDNVMYLEVRALLPQVRQGHGGVVTRRLLLLSCTCLLLRFMSWMAEPTTGPGL